MNIIRWLLIIPSMILGFYIGLFAAIYLYEFNVRMCPTEYIVTGMCSAPWSSFFDKLPFIIGPIIAATLIVLLPSLAAPSHRILVATTAYIFGLILVAYIVVQGPQGIFLPAISSVLGGGIAVWFTHRVLTRRSSGTPQKRGAP